MADSNPLNKNTRNIFSAFWHLIATHDLTAMLRVNAERTKLRIVYVGRKEPTSVLPPYILLKIGISPSLSLDIASHKRRGITSKLGASDEIRPDTCCQTRHTLCDSHTVRTTLHSMNISIRHKQTVTTSCAVAFVENVAHDKLLMLEPRHDCMINFELSIGL